METRNSTTAVLVTGALAFLLSACSSDTKEACVGDNCEAGDSLESASKDAAVSPSSKAHDAGAATTKAEGASSASGTKHTPQVDAAVSVTRGALPCDVKKLMDNYCATCHGASPSFGAQMSLTSLADFAAKAPSDPTQKVSAVVGPRINATVPSHKMPPVSSKQLKADELATLNAWLTAGTPAGTEACTSEGAGTETDVGAAPSAGDPHLDPSLTCYKLVAHNGDGKTPFKVGVAKDAYYNLVFAAPWKGTVYARVISPVIDNPKAIHHWLLFQDDAPGTPGAPTNGSGAHPSGQLINGWAPGGQATDFRAHPGDLGMELPGNTTYTVEYHYNSEDASALDASGVEVCVTQQKPASVVGMSWLGNDNLLVPQTEWTGTCQPAANSGPITIIGVSPHMHKAGVHMKAVINRAGGKTDILHDEDFDFAYQIQYAKNIVINPGDTITTTCIYDKPMTFGESTDAEMCYLFTMAYPKNGLSDGLPWGGIAHGGSSCLGQ